MPPVSTFAPAGDRLVDPLLDALGGRLVDQRADVGLLVGRVAGAQRLDRGDQPVGEGVVDGRRATKTRCTAMQHCPAW